MDKKLIIIVLAILILLGGFVYLFTSKKNPEVKAPTVSTQTSEVSPIPAATTQNKSLKELMAAGVTQKCTFTKNENCNSNTVTVYIDNGKIRGDIDSVTADKTVNSHMIVQGTTTYFWMEGQKTGFKIALNTNPQATGQPQAQNTGVNPDEKVDYNCTSWSADQSMFTLPTDVIFSDFGKKVIPSLTVPKAGSKTPDTTDKCAACNYLTGDAKAQCLTALNCN